VFLCGAEHEKTKRLSPPAQAAESDPIA
jgi:hypothetical protein